MSLKSLEKISPFFQGISYTSRAFSFTFNERKVEEGMKKYTAILLAILCTQALSKSVKLPPIQKRRSEVKVHLPRGFKKQAKWPLIISLHGYGGSSLLQKYYVRLGVYDNKYGFVYAAPNGLKDNEGKGFWNASHFCCDFDETQVDDVAYIKSVIDQIASSKEIGRIDMNQVFLVGYSNGAFLASKIACSEEVNIAGIVTISGTSDLRGDDSQLLALERSLCEHKRAIPMLHVHGTDDETIPYEGKDNGVEGSVSALTQVARWADQNECKGSLLKLDRQLNATNLVRGKETEYFAMQDCLAPVEHFKINGGGHSGLLKRKFTKAMLEFLFRQK